MSVEKQEIEVFGTKEVSVKEFMGSTDKSLILLADYDLSKKNLEELKLKHEARVLELVSVEELAPEELKELNSIRAELREPRYLVQNIEKNNISVFESYKKTDKANLKSLIEINKELEDKASDKIKLEDDRKKAKKEAEAKAEEVRVATLKAKIETFESDCYVIIQGSTIENVEENKSKLDALVNEEFDYEEYDILFEQARSRVQSSWDLKCNDIQLREEQRLENERMKQEIFEVRVKRMAEVGYNFVDDVFIHKTLALAFTKQQVYDCSSLLFEDELSDIKNELEKVEQAKRDVEIKKQKDEQFEVRKNRLAEIGFVYGENVGMNHKEFTSVFVNTELVYNASIIEFEEILSNARQSIVDAEIQKAEAIEKAKQAEELALKQKEEADKKAIADKKKADAENKARVKRLAKDKESIAKAIEIYFLEFNVEAENQEAIDLVSYANLQIGQIKADLLTKLNEL